MVATQLQGRAQCAWCVMCVSWPGCVRGPVACHAMLRVGWHRKGSECVPACSRWPCGLTLCHMRMSSRLPSPGLEQKHVTGAGIKNTDTGKLASAWARDAGLGALLHMVSVTGRGGAVSGILTTRWVARFSALTPTAHPHKSVAQCRHQSYPSTLLS